MRRVFGIAVAALAACALAGPGTSKIYDAYLKSISSADSLHAVYTVQAVGGAPAYYTLDLKKPNQLRLDSNQKTIVADGTTITTLDKINNVFSKRPQTDQDIKKLFDATDLCLWYGFLNSDAAKPHYAADQGKTDIAGKSMDTVAMNVDKNARRGMTVYVSPDDGLIHQAQIVDTLPAYKATTVVSADEVTLGAKVAADRFTFSNTGATEVAWSDMQPLSWSTDLKAAMAAAKSKGQFLLVDYYSPDNATWAKLNKEVFLKQPFRTWAKKVVICRIYVNTNKRTGSTTGAVGSSGSMGSTTSITKVPTEVVYDKEGKLVDTLDEYTDADAFYEWLKSATDSQ